MTRQIGKRIKKDARLRPGSQGRWKENRYLPTSPVLTTDGEKAAFLEALRKCRGVITRAAREVRVSYRSVYRRMAEDPDFAEAVQAVREELDRDLQGDLEEISQNMARKPSATTERIFQLNALDPGRYRVKPAAPAPPQVNITFGFSVPPPPHGPRGMEVTPEDEDEIPGTDQLGDVDL